MSFFLLKKQSKNNNFSRPQKMKPIHNKKKREREGGTAKTNKFSFQITRFESRLLFQRIFRKRETINVFLVSEIRKFKCRVDLEVRLVCCWDHRRVHHPQLRVEPRVVELDVVGEPLEAELDSYEVGVFAWDPPLAWDCCHSRSHHFERRFWRRWCQCHQGFGVAEGVDEVLK